MALVCRYCLEPMGSLIDEHHVCTCKKPKWKLRTRRSAESRHLALFRRQHIIE